MGLHHSHGITPSPSTPSHPHIQSIPTCITDECKWNIWLCRPVWSAWVSTIPMASPPPPPPLPTPTYNLYLLALRTRVNETSDCVDQSGLHGSPPFPWHHPLPLHPLPTPHWYQAIPTCIMDESNIWKSDCVDQSGLHGSPSSPWHYPLPLHPLPTPHWYQAIPTCIMDESKIWNIWLCRPVWSAWVFTRFKASSHILCVKYSLSASCM